MENALYAAVYVDVALDKPLDYAVPAHLMQEIRPGTRVKVLLQKRSCSGTVLELKNRTDSKKNRADPRAFSRGYSFRPFAAWTLALAILLRSIF